MNTDIEKETDMRTVTKEEADYYLDRLSLHNDDEGAESGLRCYIEQSQPVPEGCQLVPVKPTPDMRHAFNEILDRFEDGDWSVTIPDDAYRAMLAAAKENSHER